MGENIEIRECTTLEELAECVELQREVFALPDIELSPVRHLIVAKNAGGFTLGAYDGGRLVGFVLSLPAVLRGEPAFYSHMTGVRAEYQSHGLGARLKWAQRDRALADGVKFVKWTFEPIKARNAYFNLEKLGAVVFEYQANFYGTDYVTAPEVDGQAFGLLSDRLFAEWHLESEKVRTLARGERFEETRKSAAEITLENDWMGLVQRDAAAALALQLRLREEFQAAIGNGLMVGGFRRDEERPQYLLFDKDGV